MSPKFNPCHVFADRTLLYSCSGRASETTYVYVSVAGQSQTERDRKHRYSSAELAGEQKAIT